MEYNADGKPVLRVDIGSDININGDVNIPGTVTVNSTPQDPVHTHITEVGTSGVLTTAYLPVGGTVSVNQPVAVTDNNGSLTVDGSVSVSNFPATQAVTGTFWQATQPVSIASLPEVEIKNDSGNPITVTGSVTTIGGSAQGKLWTMQVAQGLIAGHTVEQVTGYNPSTSAGDAVWSAGTAYPWSSFATAQTLYLKSSTNNATDRSMSILIDGLDSNYANQTEVITLNASDSRTAVASTKQFLRIHNIQCNGADTNVGDIITTVTSGTGTVVSKISAGRGSARAGCFTIPAGYTGYLFKGDASSTAATVVNFMARYYGKAFMVVHVAIVDNSTYIYDFPFPMPLPEKTDMYCTIEAGSGKTAVNYEILLVAN
jgi:DNA/RNA endonuclease YhcR with UshA esterase domain